MSLIVCRLIRCITECRDVDIRKRLGRNLRRLRKAKGLSQEAFADDVGIHRTYVSDLERGRRNPTITIVEKLAVFLAVRPGELLDE
ncbi:helix-turn-helix transcriptional regulator [Mesorhizobium sp.]|uniref:helix-turn-helix domain-containing protein n=1 Tax=Mesorhizobium sp. TaxID=1871066 RepID=UPI000FE8C517|nr:helix-turn-helix transcriptional regulator [Mesorhizobium sp.]RWH17608.1 MAG: XRE family transcriptional regulator [Mesorhizobium sp.]RWH33203.1 MAG: XRE family transcriptional regulator [Mesorhizobium sp.]TIR56285.1 MAG: helix-turn-helix transcriptional regulator [Mesorhizobium sp.]TIR67167.1 MAG: helix-turn-helix transcriptional regulator [Mesorhizobium sp.]